MLWTAETYSQTSFVYEETIQEHFPSCNLTGSRKCKVNEFLQNPSISVYLIQHALITSNARTQITAMLSFPLCKEINSAFRLLIFCCCSGGWNFATNCQIYNILMEFFDFGDWFAKKSYIKYWKFPNSSVRYIFFSKWFICHYLYFIIYFY